MWLIGGIGFAVFGGLALASCGITPDTNLGPSFEEMEDEGQDYLVNNLFDAKYLDADLDINVKYQAKDATKADNYHVTGDALLDIASLDNIGADVTLKLDMNDEGTPEKDKLPIIDFDFTYVDSTFYLDLNDRLLKLKTDDVGELVDLVLGSGDNSSEDNNEEQTNLSNSGIIDIITNIADMSFEDKGTYYQFVAKTTENQPDIVITSDLDYKITSLSIVGITYQDFTIDVKMNTTILESLENEISSPEVGGKKYIDLTNYYGALRKLRTILDDEEFGMDYKLELSHYEPATPETKVYLGYTTGDLNMDLANTTIDLAGNIYINDSHTETHDDYMTTYHGQYLNECVYLDYKLNNGGAYKLAYSNAGLSDMWDLLGDDSVFGINIFDLIFGASDKEYPILDILTDAAYRNISKYGSINFIEDYIEVDIDNYLLGGLNHGKIKINLDSDKNISSITISDLDINSYIVDGTLLFSDYASIKPVNKNDGYSSLDTLDDLIRSGAKYFRSNKYNLGVNVSITNSNNEELLALGDVQLNLENTLAGHMNVTVNDFNSHVHNLKLDSLVENNINNVYGAYTYQNTVYDIGSTVKVKASYDSIVSIYQNVMDAISKESSEDSGTDILGMVTPFIANASLDTIERIMNEGDYFAILRDEAIKELSVNNNVYHIVLAKEVFGFDEDVTLNLTLSNENVLTSIYLSTTYNSYALKATINLNEYDDSTSYIEGNLSSYTDCNSLTEFVSYIADTSDNGTFKFMEQFSDIMENKKLGVTFDATISKLNSDDTLTQLCDISNGRVDAQIREETEEDKELLDRIDAVISGTINSEYDDNNAATKHLDLAFGYKDDYLSFKLGNALKVYCTQNELKDIIDNLNDLLSNEALGNFMNGTSSVSLPIIQMLDDGNYQALIDSLDGIAITGTNLDELTITLSNGLLNENDTSSFDLTVKISQADGIEYVTIDGLRYAGYVFSGTINLDTYDSTKTIDPINDGYTNIAHIGEVIEQIDTILTSKQLGLDLAVDYGPTSISASGDVDLSTHQYAVEVNVLGEEYLKDTATVRDVTRVRVESDGVNTYLIYQLGEKDVSTEVVTYSSEVDDTVRVKIAQTDINTIVTTLKDMIGNEDSYVYEVVAKYLGDMTATVSGSDDSSFDIASLIYKEVVKSMTPNSTDHTLTLVLDGEALGLQADVNAVLTFNVNDLGRYSLSNVTGNTVIDSNNAALNVSIRDYNENNVVISEEEINEIDAIGSSHGGWVGAGSISNALTYIEDLGYNTQKAAFDQVESLMNDKTAGLSYEITIGKKASTPLITATGDLNVNLQYLDLNDLTNLSNIKIGLTNGTIKNTDEGLDAAYDLRLVDGVAYFLYQHDVNVDSNFKVRYTLTELQELKDLIYQEAETNPTLAAFINSLFPEGNEEDQSPLNKALSSGNYISLLNYYKNCYVSNNVLYLVFDGALINNTGNIEIGLDTSNAKGINGIYVKDFYAFGYYLTGSFVFNTPTEDNPCGYVAPVAPTNANEYVTLDHVNDMFTDIIELFGDSLEKEVAYDLSVTYGKMRIDGDIDFLLNTDADSDGVADHNIGNLDVIFTSGKKTHYLNTYTVADLYQNNATYKQNIKELADLYAISEENRTEEESARITTLEEENQTIIDAANDASNIYFSYGDVDAGAVDSDGIPKHGSAPSANNMMYGRLTLGTIGDVYNLIQKVTDSENSRFANIMEMFSSEGSNSVFSKILGGDIEAFLYNKVVNSFTYDEPTQTYTLVVEGDIFKANETDEVEDITLTLQMENQKIKMIGISGTYEGDKINATLTSVTYEAPSDINVPSGKSQYDFSTVDDLVDHLLNTVTADDFVFSGDIDLRGAAVGFDIVNYNFGINAFVHIEKDNENYENIYGYMKIDSIDFMHILTYCFSDDRDTWSGDNRTFEIYFANVVNYDEYGNAILDSDGNVSRTTTVAMSVYYVHDPLIGSNSYKTKNKSVSMDDFTNDLAYYLLNFGIGVKAKTSDLPSNYPEDDLSTNANDFLNFHSYDIESDYTPTYSKLLQGYNYYETGTSYTSTVNSDVTATTTTPSWVATIDGGNLLNNSTLGNIELLAVGDSYLNSDNETTTYLSRLLATTSVTFNVADATLYATIDFNYLQGQAPSSTKVETVKEYVNNHPVGDKTYTVTH